MSDTDNNNHAACVRKYLDANLAHITSEEFDALPSGEGVTCELRDHGAWVFVNWDIGDISADEFPNLRRLMMLAKGLGCNWICLDVEGPYLDGVPTHGDEDDETHYAWCANCRTIVPFDSDGQPLEHDDWHTGRTCGE